MSEALDALLVDGTNLCYRAYYAQARPDAEPDPGRVAAVAAKNVGDWYTRLGLTRQRTIVCLDGDGATARRKQIDPQYKAQRSKRPEALTVALQAFRRVLDEQGGRTARMEGHEADDVIATYARLMAGRRLQVAVLTSDHDLLQTIEGRVRVFLIGQKVHEATEYDEPTFRARYAFLPPLMADYKAIRGDGSDNIGGVPGIGEVKGRAIVGEYGTVEEVYDRIGQGRWIGSAHVTGLLRRHEERVRRNLRLTTLDREVPGVALRG